MQASGLPEYSIECTEQLDCSGVLETPGGEESVLLHLRIFTRYFDHTPLVTFAEGMIYGFWPSAERIGRILPLRLSDGRRFRIEIDNAEGFFYATGPLDNAAALGDTEVPVYVRR